MYYTTFEDLLGFFHLLNTRNFNALIVRLVFTALKNILLHPIRPRVELNARDIAAVDSLYYFLAQDILLSYTGSWMEINARNFTTDVIRSLDSVLFTVLTKYCLWFLMYWQYAGITDCVFTLLIS